MNGVQTGDVIFTGGGEGGQDCDNMLPRRGGGSEKMKSVATSLWDSPYLRDSSLTVY